MRSVRLFTLISLFLPFLIASAAAQQIRFIPDFSGSTANLQFNNSQTVQYSNGVVLRLTPPTGEAAASTAYFKIPQPVTMGFSTYFAFQMHQPTQCCTPGDGFAFIVQNSNATDPTQGATGAGLTAVGSAMGGVGYSGINDSLAIEFDILANGWDPNSNHIAIQTCGGDPAKFNSPVHVPGSFTIGNNHNVTSCLLSQGAINSNLPSMLGPSCNGESCNDGPVHQVVVEYTPAAGQHSGELMVFLDPVFQPHTHTPVLGSVPVVDVPYNITYSPSNPLGLNPASFTGLFAGFTASVEDGGTTTDVLAWEFTPHSPSEVTQVIQSMGMETDFTFGGHQLGVTYPTSFMNPNNSITMTVLETPVNQQTFYTQRLMGTNFANESCIIYLSTGGNCVVYSVTCQQNGVQITCPPESGNDIAICTQFYTSLPVSQLSTDFLEAEPIGSNNWCSIWTGFQQQDPRDPIVSGKGSGFSDIVATLSPTGPGQPQCGGGLKVLTKEMEKVTQKQPPPTQPQSNFCPKID